MTEPLWLRARRLRFAFADLPKSPDARSVDAHFDWAIKALALLDQVDDHD